jgi:cytochrome oxidase Cu insertion factor (SCO1/SenC/PrrC family)
MKRALAVALVLAAAVATPAARAMEHDPSAIRMQPYDPPKPAPAFALPDLSGKTVRLGDFKGKIVLVFFWATW